MKNNPLGGHNYQFKIDASYNTGDLRPIVFNLLLKQGFL
jgi:hypothetical protein